MAVKVLSSLPISVAGAEIYSFDYESFNRNSDRYNTQQNLPISPLQSIDKSMQLQLFTPQKSNCCSSLDFEEVIPSRKFRGHKN